MHIFKYLLRVIFMLSTIVSVTDCCSSRILFLKEQTFNIVQQHKMQQYQQYIGHEPPAKEKYEQNVFGNNLVNEHNSNNNNKINNNNNNYNKHHIIINSDNDSVSDDKTAKASGKDRPPPREKGGGGEGGHLEDIKPFGDFGKQLGELILKDAVMQGKKANDKPVYQLIDIYQSIMDNVLSFACTGQFLTDFCLNGGRCFRVPMGNQSLFSCECADGYVGERCESKSVNGVFVPSSQLEHRKPKILTARIVFSFPMLILLTVIYLLFGMAIVFKCQPPFRAKYTPQTSRAAGLLLT